MFKSCQYCRHRKKRCTLPPPDASDSRCFACQHLNIACEIGVRKPSLKRQLKSQQIASRLYATSPHGPSPPPILPGVPLQSVLVQVSNGDCQIPRSDTGAAANKIIIMGSSPGEIRRLTTKEKYHSIVKREFPFIPDDWLEDGDTDTQTVLNYCIALAAQLSLQKECSGVTNAELRNLSALLDDQSVKLTEAAGLMLLLPRIHLDPSIIEKAFMAFSTAGIFADIPLPLAVGSLTASTWLSLVGVTPPPMNLSTSILLDYGRGLDQTSFAPHYLKLTHLAASFLDLQKATDQGNTTRDSIQAWARLEYMSLLNVAQMPSEFLDVRDEMPATPAAVVTHMLQSTIFLRLYDYVLSQKPTLGQALGLRPVPGVVHFLCAVARSVFVCQRQIVEHWSLLADVQATAAQILLDLWELTKAENCRALLNLWEPAQGRFESLSRTVREKIGHGPWAVEVIDGYSVFWTFRDLRSLSLEVHMRP